MYAENDTIPSCAAYQANLGDLRLQTAFILETSRVHSRELHVKRDEKVPIGACNFARRGALPITP